MKKLLLTTAMWFIAVSVYTQTNPSTDFITRISDNELSLNTAQSTKLNRMRTKVQYKSVMPVGIGNIADLQRKGGVLPVQIPGSNETYLFKATRIEAYDDWNYIWEGKLPREEGIITIYYKEDRIFGQIDIGRKIYQIKDLGSKQNVLIEVDESQVSTWNCAHENDQVSKSDRIREPAIEARTHCHVVSVLVLFTPEAEQAGDPEDDAEFFIDQSNQPLMNNNIDANTLTFVLAGVEPFDIDDDPDDIEADREELRDDEDAQDLRDQHDADLVVLLTDADYWINDPGQGCFPDNPPNCIVFGTSSLADWGESEDGAWTIVEIDSPNNRFTFTHEVAHNFGARHDIEDDPVGTIEHGFRFVAGGLNRATIMGTTPDNDLRIQQFSNPNQQFLGVDIGVEDESDNTQHIPQQVGTISSFRTGCLQLNASISYPNILSNYEVDTWTVTINNCNDVDDIQWARSTDGIQYTNISGGTSTTQTMAFNSNMYLRVTVECEDGQTTQAFRLVLNPDAEECDPCLRVQEDPLDRATIELFPNPPTNFVNLNVEITKRGIYDIFVMDGFGQKERQVYKGYLEPDIHRYSLNTFDMTKGIKYLILLGEDEITTTKMVIF